MFLNKLYYLLKPLIPLQVRILLRQKRADWIRENATQVWPIDPNAGKAPPRWPGWPQGKRFALVLTHDVESSKGLQRIAPLIRLESQYGLRSSFNLIPERDYTAQPEHIQAIEQADAEVGVHGLKHDGKLYNSKAIFASRASRINQYIHQWKAVGFRAPLMQHKLSWHHQLEVEYDASTFDTDPFEPQPDGVSTIFPFWVPGPKKTGYVELPYTMVQDFNLFIILREKNIEIWKKKLDWIAERGGMALLTTHPDYMCFEGTPEGDEFPVSYYEDFLRYVTQKYAGSYWPALPREVSRYYTASVAPAARNTRRRVCMIVYNYYRSDNRVRRYAEALVKRGDQVDVISICGPSQPLGEEEIEGVHVFRVQHREYNEGSKWTFAERLLRFLVASSVLLTRRHSKLRYDLVHIHNMPDFLVFAAWYPKWTGAKVILDIHDIVPELFANKFQSRIGNLYSLFLKKLEKASARFANHVIVSNHLWWSKLVERSVPERKCSVFINHVDHEIFYRRPRTRNDDRFIILFHGSFQWHQGLELAIEAMAIIKDRVPQAELHFYGGGGGPRTQENLEQLAAQLGVSGRVKFCGGVNLDQIPDIIANADLGVVPKRADSFGNEAYSTKIMEFMSQGIPVVVSKTKIDSYYFDDKVVRFFTSGDSQSMADAIMDVIENPALRQSLIHAALEYADTNGWGRAKEEYFELVDTLCVEPFDSSSRISRS